MKVVSPLIRVRYSINAILISHFLLDLHEANQVKAYRGHSSGMEIIGTLDSSFVAKEAEVIGRDGRV